MASQLMYFKQQEACDWQWPVQVGVFDKPEFYIELLGSLYWSQRLNHIEKIDMQNKHYNIVFADCSIDDMALIPTDAIMVLKEVLGEKLAIY